MSFTVDYFSTLCEQFPTWDEMKTHLESQGLRIVVPSTDNPDFNLVVVRAVKGKSKEPAAGLFRSVVWNTVTNRPVCYAPPKAREGQPPLHTPLSLVQDFMDGFMVNAFVTAAEPTTLRLVTRTTLGAENRFYSTKTFATLFDEALAATPVRTREALLMHLREWMADTQAAFVSFVVQHPEHRIVAKPASPDLHIVHMGSVDTAANVILDEAAATWPASLKRLQISRYPVKQFHSEQEVTDLMRRTAVTNGFRWQGLVFKDGTGARWRLRSPSYTMMRTLRGAEAAPVDRFLRLRREGKVLEYLKHYGDSQSFPGTANDPSSALNGRMHGEERKTFWGYEQTLRARTADVLAAYEQVHKAHALKFADLPGAYKPAVHLLHVKFLEELRAKGFKVILRNAVDVVNHLKDFEQKRLLDAEAFVAPAASAGGEEEETGAPEETASAE